MYDLVEVRDCLHHGVGLPRLHGLDVDDGRYRLRYSLVRHGAGILLRHLYDLHLRALCGLALFLVSRHLGVHRPLAVSDL